MEALISFRHPLVLFLELVPAALLVAVFRDRGRRLVLPLDHGVAGKRTRLRFLVRPFETIPALLLAIALLLLAGPQRWDEPRTRRALTNIEFCVDVSGSMMAQFAGATRYDAAMEAINGFLDYRSGDAFGLTFFGNAVLHWVPLTTDTSAFRCAPPFMRPGQLPMWFGGTEIGRALLACRKILVEREEGDRMIVLVTDGYSADLGGDRDQEIARSLQRDGIVVYSIHIAETEVPEPIVTITALTGGEVFQPGDQEGLAQIFRRIDQMQQTKLEKVRSEALDWYEPFCLAGLGLLGVALLGLFGLRHTPW
jgi:Ca-activated chloride channel family protein